MSTAASGQFYELTFKGVTKKVHKSNDRPLTSTIVGRIFGVRKPDLITLRSVGSDVMIFPLDNGQFELTGTNYEVDEQTDTERSPARHHGPDDGGGDLPGQEEARQGGLRRGFIHICVAVAGHQRAIMGLMTVGEIYQDRKKFSKEVSTDTLFSTDVTVGPAGLQPIRMPPARLAQLPANAVVAPPAPALAKPESKHRFFVTLGEWSRDGKIHPLKNRPEKMIVLTEGDATLGNILTQIRDYFNDQTLLLYTARFHVVPDDESSQGLANWRERTKNRTRHYAAPPPPSSDSEGSEDEDTARRQSRKKSAKRVAQKIKHLGKAYKPNCTICYEVLRTDEASKSCNLCGHMFHEDCIGAWLVANPEKCAHCGSNYVSFFNVRLD